MPSARGRGAAHGMMAGMRTSPLAGRRPRRDELAAFSGGTVDDILGPDPLLLVVGINPGLWTAAVNAPFAHPANRFWPSLHQAGLTPWRVDAAAGLAAADEQMMHDRRIALTNLVNRATARADELRPAELRAGRERVERVVAAVRPRVVVIVGITAHRTAFRAPKARMGRQEPGIGDAELWVIPQPSGLNAHAPLPVLVEWWQQVGRAAGLV